MSTSSAATLKAALYSVCQTLYANSEVFVSYGHPGTVNVNDIVSIGRVSGRQDYATMSPSRSREEELTLEVMYSVFRGGDMSQEQVAVERAYALLAQLETYCRTTDTTLGGVVRWCMLTDHSCESSADPDIVTVGRIAELTATFTAHVRL